MSSSGESDDEYVPGEPEQLSEEDSADDETEQQYEKEKDFKAKKRKAIEESNSGKKSKTLRNSKIDINETEHDKTEELQVNPEEEKKREEDLWAQFLEGTDTKPKPKETQTKTNETPKVETKEFKKPEKPKEKETAEEKERRIFEFAGETIVVENNVIKEKIKTGDIPTASKPSIPSRGKGAGLSSLVGQLNKKNKLSTLEKSKLDWNTYKKEEDIEEEIKSHNKGKAGYLDRQDFLERADVRQYEIERDLRLNKRSNR